MSFLSKKIISVSLIAALFVTTYIIFFVHVRNINEKIGTIQGEMRNEDGREIGLRRVGRSLAETSVERRKLEELFIPKEGEVPFIISIEELARNSGVTVSIDSLKVEKTQFEGIEKIDARIIAKGSFGAVRDFFDRLNNMNKAIDWKRAMFSKNIVVDESVTPSSWTLTSEISAFKLK